MQDFLAIKKYVHFTDEDVAILRRLQPIVRPHLAAMAERFYAEIPNHPDAFKVFSGPEQIERLKRTLQRWGEEVFSGEYGEAYARSRYQIGHVHVRIHLPQKYVISAMALVREFLHEVVNRDVKEPDFRMQAHISMDKILDIDLNLMCETFFTASIQTLTDLNERLEEANRKLRESSEVKSEFLAKTSHELRTPLSSILGFIRLVLDGVCENRDEEVELLNDAFQAAEHLLSIVNDLLDVARIEAGKLEIHLRPFDLAPIIKQVLALNALEADRKGIQLTDLTQNREFPQVYGDPERFKQVLINILGNAVKFTDAGGVTLEVERRDGFVVVEVGDTGIGIDKAKQAELFEKFKQVDSSHTRRHGGSGLGLVISKHLVERMGGTIELTSQGLGHGTRVALTIPLYPR